MSAHVVTLLPERTLGELNRRVDELNFARKEGVQPITVEQLATAMLVAAVDHGFHNNFGHRS